jgi:hypothetical protein
MRFALTATLARRHGFPMAKALPAAAVPIPESGTGDVRVLDGRRERFNQARFAMTREKDPAGRRGSYSGFRARFRPRSRFQPPPQVRAEGCGFGPLSHYTLNFGTYVSSL